MNGRTHFILAKMMLLSWCFSALSWATDSNLSRINNSPSRIEIRVADTVPLSLSFAQIPRADEAVIHALNATEHSMSDIDWLSSALFDVMSPYATKRQTLLAIAHQENLADLESKVHWRKLKQQLRAMSFAKRVFMPLDPDVLRISPEKNPRLKGKWLLTLPKLADEVLVIGNVKQPGQIKWRARQDANYYLDLSGRNERDISHVWVIQPDGHAKLHSIAYWNDQFESIAPGATVYVPFPLKTTSLYPQYALNDVNHMIVELLRNQLPL